MRHTCLFSVTALALCLATYSTAQSQERNDRDALSGLSEVKVAFDLTSGDSKALLTQLSVIDETRQSLIAQGVKPKFVVAFRGPATKLVQTDVSLVPAEHQENLSKIAEKVKGIRTAEGIDSVEQCSVAIRMAGTKAENVLPDIKVVGNSWVSLAAYQSKGYGYISP